MDDLPDPDWRPRWNPDLSVEANLRHRRMAHLAMTDPHHEPDLAKAQQDEIDEHENWLLHYVWLHGSPRTDDVASLAAYRAALRAKRTARAMRNKHPKQGETLWNGEPVGETDDPTLEAIADTDLLAAILASLTPLQRHIVLEAHLLGTPTRKIALTLGLTTKQVRIQLDLARTIAKKIANPSRF